MMPQPSQPAPAITLAEILQAILAGIQIAAAALPVIQGYEGAFGTPPSHITPVLVRHATDAHPIAGAVVSGLLAPVVTGN